MRWRGHRRPRNILSPPLVVPGHLVRFFQFFFFFLFFFVREILGDPVPCHPGTRNGTLHVLLDLLADHIDLMVDFGKIVLETTDHTLMVIQKCPHPRNIIILVLLEFQYFPAKLLCMGANRLGSLFRLDLGLANDESCFLAGILLRLHREPFRRQKSVPKVGLHALEFLETFFEFDNAFTEPLVIGKYGLVLLGNSVQKRVDLVRIKPSHGLLEFLFPNIERCNPHLSASSVAVRISFFRSASASSNFTTCFSRARIPGGNSFTDTASHLPIQRHILFITAAAICRTRARIAGEISILHEGRTFLNG